MALDEQRSIMTRVPSSRITLSTNACVPYNIARNSDSTSVCQWDRSLGDYSVIRFSKSFAYYLNVYRPIYFVFIDGFRLIQTMPFSNDADTYY